MPEGGNDLLVTKQSYVNDTEGNVILTHTLIMPKVRPNDFDAAFKLRYVRLINQCGLFAKKVKLKRKISGCGLYTGVLSRPTLTVLCSCLQMYCTVLGADLAVIESSAEQVYIEGFLQRMAGSTWLVSSYMSLNMLLICFPEVNKFLALVHFFMAKAICNCPNFHESGE